jgi:hypothetical protein
MCTWKCHKETPWEAILTTMSIFFFCKIGEQEDGTGPVLGGWYHWEAGGGGESVEGEYGANTGHTCMEMEK